MISFILSRHFMTAGIKQKSQVSFIYLAFISRHLLYVLKTAEREKIAFHKCASVLWFKMSAFFFKEIEMALKAFSFVSYASHHNQMNPYQHLLTILRQQSPEKSHIRETEAKEVDNLIGQNRTSSLFGAWMECWVPFSPAIWFSLHLPPLLPEGPNRKKKVWGENIEDE